MTKKDREKLINQLKKVLAKQPIKLAYLYGSYARGQETPKSDIDIAVVMERNSKKADYEIAVALQSQLGKNFPEIDIRSINLENPSVFLRNVLKEGKPLVVKDESERINFEVNAMKKFYDASYVRNFMKRYLYQKIKEDSYGRRQTYN